MRGARLVRLALVAGAAAASGGCFHHGLRLKQVMPEPGRGAMVRLRVPATGSPWAPSGELSGELIVVRDTLLVLAQPDRLIIIPTSAVAESWIGDTHEERSTRHGQPGVAAARRIRAYARHPYGLSNAQIAVLMRAAGADRLVFVRGPGPDALVALPLDSLPDAPAVAAPLYARSAEPDPVAAAFLDTLRAQGPRFARVEDAIAAGYRQLGPAFPGMGEHWIQPGLVVSGRVDPTAPAVLAYATIADERRLIAAAFTVPLEPGEAPPAYPAGRGVWHDHSDRVDEEILLLAHPASHMAPGERPRLAMFHAWLWLENPDGVFAQNNWTLPFAQAGLTPGVPPSPHAARALSLATAGPDYYMMLFEAAAPLGDEERGRLRALLRRHAASVSAWRAERGAAAGREDMLELEGMWLDFWQDVRGSVGDRSWERLARLVDERLLAAVRRPIRPRELRLFGSVGAPMYYAHDAPPSFMLGAWLPVSARAAVRAQYEQSEARAMGRVCYAQCYARGSGTLRFWNIGVDVPLGRFAGRRGRIVAALGLGRLSAELDTGEELGSGYAWYGSLRGEVAVLPIASVLAEAGTYIADLAEERGGLYPSFRLGLAVGAPVP